MVQAKLGDLSQRTLEPVESTCSDERSNGLELELRSLARADEVCVVGVGAAVRMAARRGHDRAFLECENGLCGAGEREDRLDRVPALGVRHGMRGSLDHAEARARIRGEIAEQRRRLEAGCPQLEVR